MTTTTQSDADAIRQQVARARELAENTPFGVLSRAVEAGIHFLQDDHEYDHAARCEIVGGALTDALAAARKMNQETT